MGARPTNNKDAMAEAIRKVTSPETRRSGLAGPLRAGQYGTEQAKTLMESHPKSDLDKS